MDVAKVKNLNAKTRGGCEMRTVGIIISIMCIVVLSSGVALGDDWHIETVDAGGDVGYNTSIALDGNNYPHIAYSDYSNFDLKYARWDGNNWQIESVDTGGWVGYWDSITLDGDNYPHISYYDNSNGDLKYTYWTGSAWNIQTIDTSGDVGRYNSITLDSSNYPHISYHNHNSGNLKYAYWTGSAWVIETVDSSANDVGYWTSIALDSSNYPHISYYDWTDGDLRYTHWNGSAWNIQLLDTAGVVGHDTSIALDTSGNPHISYYDVTNGDLKYAHWTGYTWSITSIDTAGDVGWHTSIALDSRDEPYISYYDHSNGDLKFAYWFYTYWVKEVVDTVGDVGYSTSIALNSYNKPHISYYDYGNGDLKYAWYGPEVDINLISFSAKAVGEDIVLEWSIETTEGEEIVGFNLYRRELGLEDGVGGVGGHHDALLREDVANIWLKINPTLITGENPYTYTDGDVESGLAYEYKLEAVLADESAETLGTTQATAGIPPASFAILAIYPNPASDVLTCLLAVPEAGAVELSLYDLSGRLVLDKQVEVCEPTELEAQLNISSLASGVYTLRASFGRAEVSPACGGVAVLVR